MRVILQWQHKTLHGLAAMLRAHPFFAAQVGLTGFLFGLLVR